MTTCEKIILITKKTPLEELLDRHCTRAQARFYIEHLGVSFAEYEAAHETYQGALDRVREAIPKGVRWQEIERDYLPTFTFGPTDLAVTLGPDGLVVNTAKYLREQPLVAFNPDPVRIDGVLIPFAVNLAATVFDAAMRGRVTVSPVSMARADLNDGQSIYAVNDLFIGQRTHVSARYVLQHGRVKETQSSSGVIVSTGAGSTGWFRSAVTGAHGIVAGYAKSKGVAGIGDAYRVPWDADYLSYCVREPFVSKTSFASLVFGRVDARHPLDITSQMPQGGVIFSDGIEADYVAFNSGSVARIGVADRRLHLVTQA